PIVRAGLQAIKPRGRIMQDRGLLGFAELSDGVAKRLVERAVVGPELFDRKIAPVAAAIRPEHRDSLADDGVHHIGAAGMNEGPKPGELDVDIRALRQRHHALATKLPYLRRHVLRHAGMLE